MAGIAIVPASTRADSFDHLAMTSIALDSYLVDTLLPDLVGHDRQPSAFLVYLLLYRRTDAAGESSVQISLIDIALATGLSKRSVQEAIRCLSRRRLVSIQRASITAVPVYTVRRPWVDQRASDR